MWGNMFGPSSCRAFSDTLATLEQNQPQVSAESVRAESVSAESVIAESVRAESVRAESVRAESVRAESVTQVSAESVREAGQVKSTIYQCCLIT